MIEQKSLLMRFASYLGALMIILTEESSRHGIKDIVESPKMCIKCFQCSVKLGGPLTYIIFFFRGFDITMSNNHNARL